MFEAAKEHINEIISIADECPEKYQVKCFEILLESLVRPEITTSEGRVGAELGPKPDFFSNYGISSKEWQRVFHFDGNSYSLIVKNLKEKTKTKKQVKLAILLGVKQLLENGQALIQKDLLIDACKKYAAYDSSNFAGYMKKRKDIFLSKDDGWLLTVPGQEQAAEIIKELAQ